MVGGETCSWLQLSERVGERGQWEGNLSQGAVNKSESLSDREGEKKSHTSREPGGLVRGRQWNKAL